MIAPGSSRYSSNDMVHNQYLEEAKKKTQESGRNSRPSVMPSARSQSAANGSKPKPRITKSLGIGLHLRLAKRSLAQAKYYNLIERHSAKILLTEAKYANQAKHEGLNFKRNMQDCL
ncbi:hypothetical protein Tco_0593239 [Tanacetum coccineum]